MAEIKYEVQQKIACLSEEKSGWTKEINLISWNGNEAKYDIRAWSSDHSKMGKGVTLTKDELITLQSVLNELLCKHDE